MNFLDNKKILFYGPANKFDSNTDLSFFNNYDIVFINNKFIELLQPNLSKILVKKFHLILLLNGIFTNGNPETIKKWKDTISLFFVSENCLAKNLVDIGIPLNKIVSMANNYRKFNFQGCPNMFPKLIMLFIDHNVKYSLLKVTGITFYMDILKNDYNKEDVYHPNYHNWDTKIPKELSNMTEDEKLNYHLNKIKNLGTEKTDKIVTNHFIEENYNFFIKYCNDSKLNNLKIEFDEKLESIIKDNMNNSKELKLF